MTMKTGLMTGALALVLGGFLASCSHDDDFSASIVDSKTKAYEEVFVETFGKIDPTHDWGFGASSASSVLGARTRGSSPNANEFGDIPSREDPYVVPRPLTAAQKDKVRRWFQQHPNPTGVALNYTNFFVQQVYKGHTNLSEADAACTEQYLAGNGDIIIGSNQMDYLMAGQTGTDTDWQGNTIPVYDHIFDFNFADYSDGVANVNVWDGTLDPSKGDDFNDQKVYYPDQIMLLQNSSTSSFGYKTSQSSEEFHNRYIIIPGDIIQAWDTSETNSSGENANVSGMWFVGFDYDALGDNPNQFLVHEDATGTLTVNGHDGTYSKGGADGYYSDWIVRITPGIRKSQVGDPDPIVIPIDDPTEGTDKVYMEVTCDKGRVFCEDLGNISRNDLDFNDVVFDAYVFRKDYYTTATGGTPYSTEYETYIVLLAAGGTIPVSLAGVSVHDAFGGIATGTIINTTTDADGSFGNNWVQADPVLLDADPVAAGIQPFSYTSLSDIPIVVQYSQGLLKLQYSTGAAPHKICVRGEFPAWCRERVVISTAYTRFKDYVGDKDVIWWTEVTGGSIVNDNLYPNIQPGDSNYPTLPLSVTNGRVQVSGSDATGGYTGTEVLSRRRH